MQIITLESIDSTNTYCLEHSELLEIPFLIVHALKQTAGRGRFNRLWLSSEKEDENDLSFSFIYHPISPLTQSLASIQASLAVYRTLSKILGGATKIKWPNDILWAEKKISGILIEETKAKIGPVLVIGIGLNVNSIKSKELPTSISIYEITNKKEEVTKIMKEILSEFQRLTEIFPLSRELVNEWNTACYSIGKEVEYTQEILLEHLPESLVKKIKNENDKDKEEIPKNKKANILGINEFGQLLLLRNNQNITMLSGEVIYIKD